jgi:hypothetical protein
VARFAAIPCPGAKMKRLRDRVAARVGLTMAGLALAGCGLPQKVMSAFDSPLHVASPVQTSLGYFTVTTDDASAAVANAAALQQATATCEALAARSRTIDTSASANNGRHFFTLNFQCQ